MRTWKLPRITLASSNCVSASGSTHSSQRHGVLLNKHLEREWLNCQSALKMDWPLLLMFEHLLMTFLSVCKNALAVSSCAHCQSFHADAPLICSDLATALIDQAHSDTCWPYENPILDFVGSARRRKEDCYICISSDSKRVSIYGVIYKLQIGLGCGQSIRAAQRRDPSSAL